MSDSEYLFHNETFVGGESRLARYVARPILSFIHREVASSVLLLVATAAAFIWANSPWGDSYFDFWHTKIDLAIGSYHLHPLTLEQFVNDALMAVFFFVVGLEIKRELVTGHLANVRVAMLPAIAAVGGMVVPALLYFSLNPSGDATAGWAMPMATDIAFAVGIVSLLGSRVPAMLKLFLLTLAIVDDIGAIAVIAIFYTGDLNLRWLALAVCLLVVIRVLTVMKVWVVELYVVIGMVVWFATLESGVHATIAGVALGLLAPAKPLLDHRRAQDVVNDLPERPSVEQIHQSSFLLQESVPQTERLESVLHPFTAYLIVPVFALANAGVRLTGDTVTDAATSPITWGVILGLLVGKPLGITLFTWFATRLGFELPEGLNWPQFVGAGFAAGIGFTVSILISGLAFEDGGVSDMAKIGILVASLAAAAGALLVLWWAGRGSISEETLEEHAARAESRPLDGRTGS